MIPLTNITGRLGNQMFQFAYIYSQFKEGSIPDYYVQDYNLFSKYESELKKLFNHDISYLPEIAVHVRRGANPLLPSEPKYSENPFYVNLCETDYYYKATQLFTNSTFLVFSDDIPFCKKYFQQFESKFIFSEGNDEITDLNLMASCSSQIIANSSYSYWAGILNNNPNKKVIYPTQWFSDGKQRVTFPESWIKI